MRALLVKGRTWIFSISVSGRKGPLLTKDAARGGPCLNPRRCSSSQDAATLNEQSPFSALARSMTFPPLDVPKSYHRFLSEDTQKDALLSSRRGE